MWKLQYSYHHCKCDIGMGLEWSGNETHRRSEFSRWRNLSMKSRRFCSCDREGRCWRNTWERGDTILMTNWTYSLIGNPPSNSCTAAHRWRVTDIDTHNCYICKVPHFPWGSPARTPKFIYDLVYGISFHDITGRNWVIGRWHYLHVYSCSVLSYHNWSG